MGNFFSGISCWGFHEVKGMKFLRTLEGMETEVVQGGSLLVIR